MVSGWASASSGRPFDRRSSLLSHPAVKMRITDSLYGQVLLDSWAERLVRTVGFDRLHDVSLSSLPPAFWPDVANASRWEHCLGVYHLARVAQPDDLELHAAALLHDAGQPPFSHLAEHLMVEMLGVDHEERVAELIDRMDARRLAPEIDWGSVPPLVLGEGRGQLLSGAMDLDNIDYPLRSFDDLRDAYDAVRLAGGLVVQAGTLALRSEVERDALAWQETRRRLYDRYWSHGNLVPHAMLRKAVEMVAIDGALPLSFFGLTNTAALRFLETSDPIRPILERLWSLDGYACIWEAATSPDVHIPWREMLELEAEIAGRAGVRPVDVVLELSTSRAARPLPPILTDGRLSPTSPLQPSARLLHVFAAQPTGPAVDAAEALLGRRRHSYQTDRIGSGVTRADPARAPARSRAAQSHRRYRCPTCEVSSTDTRPAWLPATDIALGSRLSGNDQRRW